MLLYRQLAGKLMAAALLLAVAGCSESGLDPIDGGGNASPISFAADLQPVFADHCLNCHSVGGSGGLDLSPDVAWVNIVDVETTNYPQRQRIVSGNPDESILYLKLIGDSGAGPSMPLNRPLLTEDITEKFRLWILDGAPKN